MTVIVNHLTLAPEQKLLRLRDVEEVEVKVDEVVKKRVQAPVRLALGFDGGDEDDLVLAPAFWGSIYEQFLDYSYLVTQDSMEVLKF